MVQLCLVYIILSQLSYHNYLITKMVSRDYLDSAFNSLLGQTGGRITGGYPSVGVLGVYGHPYIEVRNAPIPVYPQYGMTVTFNVPITYGGHTTYANANDSAETLRRRWLEYRP